MHPDIPSVILDVYNVMDTETCNDPQSSERMNLSSIVKQTEKVLVSKISSLEQLVTKFSFCRWFRIVC